MPSGSVTGSIIQVCSVTTRREADIAVENDGVKLGVCRHDFREQIAELEDADCLEDLDAELVIDRRERPT